MLTNAWSPFTRFGMLAGALIPPVPSSPLPLRPQQRARASVAMPHVNDPPALREAKTKLPGTSSGVNAEPESLVPVFNLPQHCALPAVVSPHAWSQPALTAFDTPASDITSRKRTEEMERGRGRILEMIAENRPLQDILLQLAEIVA